MYGSNADMKRSFPIGQIWKGVSPRRYLCTEDELTRLLRIQMFERIRKVVAKSVMVVM